MPLPAPARSGCRVGVKDTGGEPGYAETLLAADRSMLLGTEDDLWRRLGIGAQGVVSALADFVPGEIVEVYRRAKAGEEAGAGSSQRGCGGRGPRPKSTPPRRCSRSSRRPATAWPWAPSVRRSCRPRATTTLARCWTSRKQPGKEPRPTPSPGSRETRNPRCGTPPRPRPRARPSPGSACRLRRIPDRATLCRLPTSCNRGRERMATGRARQAKLARMAIPEGYPTKLVEEASPRFGTGRFRLASLCVGKRVR